MLSTTQQASFRASRRLGERLLLLCNRVHLVSFRSRRANGCDSSACMKISSESSATSLCVDRYTADVDPLSIVHPPRHLSCSHADTADVVVAAVVSVTFCPCGIDFRSHSARRRRNSDVGDGECSDSRAAQRWLTGKLNSQ